MKKIRETLIKSPSYILPPSAKFWLDPECEDSFPKFTKALLDEISHHTLQNYNCATLDTIQSAINAAYSGAAIGDGKGPWKNNTMATKVARQYQKARAELVRQSGQKAHFQRVELHEEVVQYLITIGLAARSGSLLKSECALLVTGTLFCLRACSLYFEDKDVSINSMGTLTVKSKFNKKNGEIVRQTKRAPPAHGLDHPRARAMLLIAQALEGKGLGITPRGSETQTSKFISGLLVRIVPEDILDLAPGTQVSSHSLRKTAASAIAAAGVDIVRGLMPWGDWSTFDSMVKYINKNYLATSFSRRMWDWLGTAGDVSLNHSLLPIYDGGAHQAAALPMLLEDARAQRP